MISGLHLLLDSDSGNSETEEYSVPVSIPQDIPNEHNPRGYATKIRTIFVDIFLSTIRTIQDTFCAKFITLLMGNQEPIKASKYFTDNFEMDGVILCAAETHVKISVPQHDKHLFFYKDNAYTLNVLMISDHTKRIRYVIARFSGAFHDGYIWDASDVDQFFRKYRNYKILGRSGSFYSPKPWLVKPISDAVPNSSNAKFNFKHAKALYGAEDCFNLLKNRFRCILGSRPLPFTPQECATIINVCCALHNMCIEYNVPEIL
ncbi:putative nuclease HARBI1 [Anopheles nili]|uniref:putative nuclease HARBI1 n=1 Tax=Anopheles nili TaxID=185578 RepID=UPI00237ADBB8|nr:putative nuclease HARBI1 [Anopheles nili]